MKKQICLSLVFLLVLLTACSGSHRFLSGQVSDVRTEDGAIVSFVLTDEDGKRTGVLVPEDAHFTSRVGADAAEERALLLSGRPETSVHVEYNGGKTTLTTDSGEKLPAYTAWFIAVNGYLEPDAASLRDGTPLDLFHWTNGTTYRLKDGTELLYERDPVGPENCIVAGQESFEALSEAAQQKVAAYFEERGLLYNVAEELERSYAFCRTRDPGGPVPGVWQDITPAASNEHVMYFLTEVDLPIHGDGTATMERLCLSDVFDRETGARIETEDLFTCSREEAAQVLLDLVQITEQPLRSEMEAAFRLEYITFSHSGVSVSFPGGSLPGFGCEYDDGLRDILQPWAVPLKEPLADGK
ncbi:MAG: hypothetical protein K2O45_11830 [Oscillospiraceae bacterium]|nr:hypothetical protein [Oscillospiraceae bacterium]